MSLNITPINADGSVPGGSAGGALTGTYPNPTLVGVSPGQVLYGSAVAGVAGSEAAFGWDEALNKLTVANGYLSMFTTSRTVLGNGAGNNKISDTFDSEDTLIGYQAGYSIQTGANTFHTFIGSSAGGNAAAGAGSTAIGQKAFVNSTTLQQSVAVGSKAGSSLLNAQSDVFVGYGAAQFITATNLGRRVHVGYNAGQYDPSDFGIFIGYGAGSQVGNTAAASGQIGIGYDVLSAATNASANIAVGYQAARAITTGVGNIAIGYQAGLQAQTSSTNVFIGYQAGYGITGSRNILLGESAGNSLPAATNNAFVAGSSSSGTGGRIDNVYFGQGYAASAPTAYTIHGTSGSGTDIAGAAVSIAGGRGTGTGVSGAVNIQTAPVGSSGSTLNALVNAAQFDGSATANDTRMLLWDVTAGALRRVTIGAADSGGTGFRVLRIPN